MTLSIGVIGAGNIGTEHAVRLSRQVAGARVQAVFDVDADRAAALAAAVGATAATSARAVVDDGAVDAVVVASADGSHAEMALACIAAGKPVLCEKPLAPTVRECEAVMAAEVAAGVRLVQVGFMRRYDEAYRVLEATLRSGDVGDPLLVHCVHRNASSLPGFTSAMSVTSSAIHEIDAARWLLDDEIVSATVVPIRPSPLVDVRLRDPQLLLLEMASGVVVEIEVFVNCRYGYHVGCEVVGSRGTTSLDSGFVGTVAAAGALRQVVPADWRARFSAAYQTELQQWVDGVRAGRQAVPSSWDGYAATAVAACCIRSLEHGGTVPVHLAERPALYAPAA